MEPIKIIHGDNTILLKVVLFDVEVDVDTILKIDYQNLIAEILTFPVIVNKFGLLLADAENKVSETKLDLEIYSAKRKEILRTKLTEIGEGKNKDKKPTKEELESALFADAVYQLKQKKVFKAQKERDYINSIYWSAKDKSDKLNKLSVTIQAGDIDEKLLNGAINGIQIRTQKSRIK